MFGSVFDEIALIMAIATGLGAIALWLRQPLIIAFIAVGMIAGDAGLGLVASGEQVELFAELGIALLLFVVGLRLDPHEIRAMGLVAITTGMGQIVITGGLGYGIAILLGFTPLSAFYIGIALTFSSTIIIVKLLSDQREIDALHGRIALGVLIVQDIVVVLVMIALTAFTETTSGNLGQAIGLVILKGSGFLCCIAVITRYILPKLLHKLAHSTELLLIFAIAWAITLASVADGLSFSKEVGAFIAGVSLASTTYRATIGAKLISLRDFLLLFFFINLGLHIDVTHLQKELIPALILSVFVLIGKPLMVMILVGMMGFRKYTSVITSLSLGQISEFSLILATLGVDLGHISSEIMGLITLVGLITMIVSTYLILDAHELYERYSPWLAWFDTLIPHPKNRLGDIAETDIHDVDVILFGLGRYGGSMIRHLRQGGLRVLGIDFNPKVVKSWRKKGILAFYGDAEDPDFTVTLPLSKAQWIVSTLPDKRMGLTLLHSLKQHHFKGKVALTSHTEKEKSLLSDEGADLVLLPFLDAAKEAAHQLIVNRELSNREQ